MIIRIPIPFWQLTLVFFSKGNPHGQGQLCKKEADKHSCQIQVDVSRVSTWMAGSQDSGGLLPGLLVASGNIWDKPLPITVLHLLPLYSGNNISHWCEWVFIWTNSWGMAVFHTNVCTHMGTMESLCKQEYSLFIIHYFLFVICYSLKFQSANTSVDATTCEWGEKSLAASSRNKQFTKTAQTKKWNNKRFCKLMRITKYVGHHQEV